LCCLVLIACRFRPAVVALATCLVSAIAVISAYNSVGPFVQHTTNESLLLLQGFTGLTTITALTLAAAVTGHRQSEKSLRKLSAELEQLALTDELTGLRNRRGFLLLAEQGLRIARRTHAKCLLLFADLDGLKNVNDTQGHPAGDELIIDAANVLTSVFRESDVIGRLGGDEFGVFALVEGSNAAATISTHLQAKIDAINHRAGTPFHLSMSFGIEELSGQVDISLEDLIARADLAMYKQKHGEAP
jgi:diguanylate cyclase (GGDEF)-like protein